MIARIAEETWIPRGCRFYMC